MQEYVDAVINDIVDGKIIVENWQLDTNYDGRNSLRFDFYYKPVWITNELIKNNTEETEEMNQFESLVGEVFVEQDGVQDVCDGKAILVCVGSTLEDFDVVQSSKGVCISKVNVCKDCGEIENEEFTFDFNEYYPVKDVKYNVRDGLLILQVIYDTETNVEIDETL